jgi:hypothetical protein
MKLETSDLRRAEECHVAFAMTAGFVAKAVANLLTFLSSFSFQPSSFSLQTSASGRYPKSLSSRLHVPSGLNS